MDKCSSEDPVTTGTDRLHQRSITCVGSDLNAFGNVSKSADPPPFFKAVLLVSLQTLNTPICSNPFNSSPDTDRSPRAGASSCAGSPFRWVKAIAQGSLYVHVWFWVDEMVVFIWFFFNTQNNLRRVSLGRGDVSRGNGQVGLIYAQGRGFWGLPLCRLEGNWAVTMRGLEL